VSALKKVIINEAKDISINILTLYLDEVREVSQDLATSEYVRQN